MKIRTKMIISFGLLLLICFFGITLTYGIAKNVNNGLQKTALHSAELILKWNIFINRTKDILILNAYSQISNKLERIITEWKKAHADFEQTLSEVEQDKLLGMSDREIKKTTASTRSLWNHLQESINDIDTRLKNLEYKILPAINISGNLLDILFTIKNSMENTYNSDYAAYSQYIFDTKEIILKLSYADHSFYSLLEKLNRQVQEGSLTISKQIIIAAILISLLILGINIFIMFLFANNITNRIKMVEHAIGALSAGNFSVKLEINDRDEFGKLSDNFEYFRENLRNNIDSIVDFMKNVGGTVSEALSQEATLYEITRTVRKATNADGSVVLLFNEYTGELKMGARTGVFFNPYFPADRAVTTPVFREEANAPVPVGGTIYGDIIKSGKPLFIKSMDRHSSDEEKVNPDNRSVSSLIITPIIVDNRIFGVLCVVKSEAGTTFTDLDFTHARAFAQYSGLTIDNLNKYILVQERNRLKGEMKVAEKIQTALLPVEKLYEGFDISAKMIPAETVGGDYYDICTDRDNNLWFAIGDVSGHGITAGLIMMMAQTSHYQYLKTHSGCSPREVIVELNSILYHNVAGRLQNNNFMTFTTIKHMGNGNMLYAGVHLDILIHRAARGTVELIETSGIFLNLLAEIGDIIREKSFILEKGDTMLLYTDGIVESRNRMNELFGMERLIEIFLKHSGGEVEALRDMIIEAALQWSRNKQDDDLTVLVIRRR